MPAGASATPRSARSCCSATDAIEAGRIAAELDRLNRERQAIEQAAVAEAEAQALHALDARARRAGPRHGLRRLASGRRRAWSRRA